MGGVGGGKRSITETHSFQGAFRQSDEIGTGRRKDHENGTPLLDWRSNVAPPPGERLLPDFPGIRRITEASSDLWSSPRPMQELCVCVCVYSRI